MDDSYDADEDLEKMHKAVEGFVKENPEFVGMIGAGLVVTGDGLTSALLDHDPDYVVVTCFKCGRSAHAPRDSFPSNVDTSAISGICPRCR